MRKEYKRLYNEYGVLLRQCESLSEDGFYINTWIEDTNRPGMAVVILEREVE